MLAIPLRISETEYSIFLVLGDDNLERIRAYDPAELSVPKVVAQNPRIARLTLKDVVICYATLAENEELIRLAGEAKFVEALRKLTRGFRYRPKEGDHDGAYVDLLKKTDAAN